MAGDIPQVSFKPIKELRDRESTRYSTQAGMWLHDFGRYDSLQKAADVLGARVRIPSKENRRYLVPYCSMLYQLFINWSGIFKLRDPHKVEELDNAFAHLWPEVLQQQEKYKNYPIMLAMKLSAVHRVIMELKQWSGLGLAVRKITGWKKETKQAVGVD